MKCLPPALSSQQVIFPAYNAVTLREAQNALVILVKKLAIVQNA